MRTVCIRAFYQGVLPSDVAFLENPDKIDYLYASGRLCYSENGRLFFFEDVLAEVE
jgi:hypothetical protein